MKTLRCAKKTMINSKTMMGARSLWEALPGLLKKSSLSDELFEELESKLKIAKFCRVSGSTIRIDSNSRLRAFTIQSMDH